MAADKEGSNAMTAYIVICFLLAGAAGVGYKLKMDQREELAQDYPRLYALNQKIGQELSYNINRYYLLVRDDVIKPINLETKAQTPSQLVEIAELQKLRDTQGPEDQIDIQVAPKMTDKRNYMEYQVEVKLKNVTLGQWEAYIKEVENRMFKYAWITDLRIDRTDQRYDKISEMERENSDGSLWNVTFMLRWFGPPRSVARPAQ